MTIETLYRVQCQGCERYLQSQYRKPTPTPMYATLFPTFTAAYDEAIRRGWTAFPLICRPCAADLRKMVADGEVPRTGTPTESRGSVPESGQSPEGTRPDG